MTKSYERQLADKIQALTGRVQNEIDFNAANVGYVNCVRC